MKTKSKSIIINSPPEKVFAQMDDFSKTGMHMSESSMMMMGMTMDFSENYPPSVASHFILHHRTTASFPFCANHFPFKNNSEPFSFHNCMAQIITPIFYLSISNRLMCESCNLLPKLCNTFHFKASYLRTVIIQLQNKIKKDESRKI